jgi:surface protein
MATNDFRLTFVTTGANNIISFNMTNTNGVSINWDYNGTNVTDSVTNNALTQTVSKTYSSAGTYVVNITGTSISAFACNAGKTFLTTIVQFGNLGITDFNNAFNGCTKLVNVPNYIPINVSNGGGMFIGCTLLNHPNISSWFTTGTPNFPNMEAFFSGCTSFNQNISNWNVSSVTFMKTMFNGCTSFNQNISNWDVSSVNNMQEMFSGATAFNNGGVALSWGNKTSNVTTMQSMFFACPSFNSDISSWNVSSVTNMNSMFVKAYAFNKNIGNWNVSSVTNMNAMFSNATAFNQNISNWDVSSVTNMNAMFGNVTAFNNGGVSLSWGNKTSKVTIMQSMFDGCSIFNSDISSWNTSSVTNMVRMFGGAKAFNQNISNWNFSSVTDMNGMFSGATAFNQNISNWDVSSVTNMNAMFLNATAFNNDGVALSWGNKTSNVVNMSLMFYTCPSFNSDISSWNVSSVTNMNVMFGGANSFNQNISNWDVSSVTIMNAMFLNATAFNNGGVALSWGNKTSKVTIMQSMFEGCANFNSNISNWNVSSVTTMARMFYSCRSFNQNISNWDVSSVTNMSEMFKNATDFNNGGVALSWGNKTSNVVNMNLTFDSCVNFNSDISGWNVSKVTTMIQMFYFCISFNCDISSWNVSSVTDMTKMFNNAGAFNKNISNWDVSSVTNLNEMFDGAYGFNNGGVPLSWGNKTRNVISMGRMFYFAQNFNADISSWNFSSIVDGHLSLTNTNYSQTKTDILVNTLATQNLRSGVSFFLKSSISNNAFDSYIKLISPPYNWVFHPEPSFAYGPTSMLLYDSYTLRVYIAALKPVNGVTYKLTNNANTSLPISTYTAITGDKFYTFNNVGFNATGSFTLTIQNDSNVTITSAIIVTIMPICFKEDSKILCFNNNASQYQYIPIQDLRKGDLVTTHIKGNIPINIIGKTQIYNKATQERIKEQLYKCSQNEFPELFEDLVITGCHCILVDNFKDEEEMLKTNEVNGGIYITYDKYRLPACVDERTSVYEKEGFHTIYHFALENDDYYMNYGIYANGLLVETSSKRYITELSRLEIIE